MEFIVPFTTQLIFSNMNIISVVLLQPLMVGAKGEMCSACTPRMGDGWMKGGTQTEEYTPVKKRFANLKDIIDSEDSDSD